MPSDKFVNSLVDLHLYFVQYRASRFLVFSFINIVCRAKPSLYCLSHVAVQPKTHKETGDTVRLPARLLGDGDTQRKDIYIEHRACRAARLASYRKMTQPGEICWLWYL
jgi:hypothetical protein